MKRILEFVRGHIADLIVLEGFGLITWGLALWSGIAALIFLGFVLVGLGLLIAFVHRG